MGGVARLRIASGFYRFYPSAQNEVVIIARNEHKLPRRFSISMEPLPGWDGPVFLTEGIYRYSKTISWIRLYIDVVGSDFFGGTCAASVNYEVNKEDGQWKRFETDLAKTQKGELVLRFRGFVTWDVVYERIGEGAAIDLEIKTIEDLAAYLERCIE